MNICKKILNSFRRKLKINGVTIEDLRLYGYCFLNEVFYNSVNEKITVEIYGFNNRAYLIRCVNDKCVMFEDIMTTKN